MAYANIRVQNIKPNDRDTSIAITSEIGFDLIPFSGSTININTLSVFMISQGGLTNRTETRTLAYGESAIRILRGSPADGYVIRIDPTPTSAINFQSNERLEFRIDVSDSEGVAMRRTILKYESVNMQQFDALSDLIREIAEIGINYEPGRIEKDLTSVGFTYRNWSLVEERAPKLFKNDIECESTDYTVFHDEGKVTWLENLRNGETVDIINANYHYSLLSDAQMISYMKSALAHYNAYRPMTSFSLKNAPKPAEAAILFGAASLAFGAIQAGWNNQQFRVQFGDDKEAQSVKENIISSRDYYKEQNTKILEEKKYNLARPVSLVIPEFTLPGGRNRFFRYMYKGGDGGFGGV